MIVMLLIIIVSVIVFITITICIYRQATKRSAPLVPQAPILQLQERVLVPIPSDEIYGFDLDPDLGLKYGDMCLICSDIMNGRNTITRLVQCNHSFHKVCIKRWFNHQIDAIDTYSCPICRVCMPNTIIETKLVNDMS